MLIEGGKSHHRPQLTMYFARSNNLVNNTVLFLDPPVQNPTTSFNKLRWPHGKIEEVQLDWAGHDTVCYQTLKIIYPQYVRSEYKNVTIKLIGMGGADKSVWLDTSCDTSVQNFYDLMKPCYKGNI